MNPNPDQVIRVPRSQIAPSPLNPRKTFPDEKIDELAANIRELGIINPLLVRPVALIVDDVRYEIVAGECRWRASAERRWPEKNGSLPALETLPILVRELSDRETLELMLSENMQRNDLTPLEEMAAFQRMLQQCDPTGAVIYTPATLAQKIGVAEGYVRHRLILEKLPKEGVEAMRSGRIVFKLARLICSCPEVVLDKVLDEVLNPKKYDRWRDVETLGYAATEKLIHAKYVKELRGSPFDQKRPDLVPIHTNAQGERVEGGACTDCPWRLVEARVVEAKCLNPVCFKKKVDIHVAAELVKATEQGCTVLSEAERERVMHDNGDLRYDTSYVDLDDRPSHNDVNRATEQRKVPTWKKIISGETKPEVIVAVDERGHVHRLVHRKEAMAAARLNGNDKFLNLSSGRGNSLDDEDRKAARKKEIAAQKLRSAQCQAVLSALVDAYEESLPNEIPLGFLHAWTPVAIRHAGSAGCILVAKRHQVERKPDVYEALKKYADGMEDWRLLACLHFELMLSEDFSYADSPHNSDVLSKASKPLLDYFQLSLTEIKDAVKAEFAAAKKEGKAKPNKEAVKAELEPAVVPAIEIPVELLDRARQLSRPWSVQQITLQLEVDFDLACKLLDALLDEKFAPQIAAEEAAKAPPKPKVKREHTARQKKALKAAGLDPKVEEPATT